MDGKTKQKLKKRKTRRNLDDLRKRSRSGLKNDVDLPNENTSKFQNGPRCNDELFTRKTLNLSLFKKTIRSKTVTRMSLSRIVNRGNVEAHESKALSNMSRELNRPQNSYNQISEFRDVCENKNNNAFETSEVEKSFNKIEGPSKVLPSPKNEFKDLKYLTSEDLYHNKKYSSNPSCINSENKSVHCNYEKFMNDLPNYLKEHFPVLTRNFDNKNIAYLKQCYFEHSYEKNNINLNCIKPAINISENRQELIIQNPMDYIQTGFLWDHSEKKPSILLSNSSSSSLSGFGSNISYLFRTSPDNQYFPHKLNQ